MKTLFSLAIVLFSFTTLLANNGYSVGSTVATFSLKNVDEKHVSLDDYKDKKGVILIFTCNHCPYAKMYEQRIMDLDAKYAAEGFPVVAINPNDPTNYPDDSYENMQKRAKKMNYSFPYLIDETQEVAKAFGAKKTPHVYVLENKNGTYLVRYIGAIDDSPQRAKEADEKYVETAVKAILEGDKISTTETKAIGCSIKWKE